jgi:hypothetical protein
MLWGQQQTLHKTDGQRDNPSACESSARNRNCVHVRLTTEEGQIKLKSCSSYQIYRTSDYLMGFVLGIKYEDFQTENDTAIKKFPSNFNC